MIDEFTSDVEEFIEWLEARREKITDKKYSEVKMYNT
jgi:DNA replication initiation complex subunit (GINS family)